MTKAQKTKAKKANRKTREPKVMELPLGIELEPDAWPKFEKLVKNAAKMGHKPHTSKSAKP